MKIKTMKSLFMKKALSLSALLLTANLSASLLQLDFTDIAVKAGSSTTYSTQGDVWRATDVVKIGSQSVDAEFRMINTSHDAPDRIFFEDVSARGEKLRVRLNNSSSPVGLPLWVQIEVKFFNMGTDNEFTGFSSGQRTIAQFDDLDSEPNLDYSDFAGIRVGDFGASYLDDPTFLEFNDTSFDGTNYRIGILQKIDGSWNAQDNETGTDPASQAPYTARFDTILSGNTHTFQFIAGVDGSYTTANRHIDMDMFAETLIIPEPGTLLLAGILLGSFGGLHLLKRRK